MSEARSSVSVAPVSARVGMIGQGLVDRMTERDSICVREVGDGEEITKLDEKTLLEILCESKMISMSPTHHW